MNVNAFNVFLHIFFFIVAANHANLMPLFHQALCQIIGTYGTSFFRSFEVLVKGKFVVTYFGAAGFVNQLEYLLEAAERCFNLPIHFLIAAQGSELSRIKKLAKTMNFKNLSFLNYQNKAGVKEVLHVTDAVYISFANFPILETTSPNKFFDGLASGKLMIVNYRGWTKDILTNQKCGFYCDPAKAEDFPTSLLPFLRDPKLLKRYQSNARQTAERFFTKERQIKKIQQLFEPKEPSDLKSAPLKKEKLLPEMILN